jgi:hypothetical protein
MGVKQKSQASAAFLGVLIVSENVVSRCCIPTTIFDGLVSGRRHLEPSQQRPNQQPVGSASESNVRQIAVLRAATKKAAAVAAAAFREIVDRWRAR